MDIRDAHRSDVAAVLALLRKAKSTVGFLPDEAVEQRADKGTLLVAVADEMVAGYLLYDLPRNDVTIRQLVVDQTARKAGIARALTDELAKRYAEQRAGIGLWCRRDFEANNVWHRLGFVPRSERSGRGSSGTVLTSWWRSFNQPDLFTVAREEDDRLIAALDTQLVIRGSDGDPVIVDKLLTDWIRADIAFGVVDHTFVELNRHEDRETRRRHGAYARRFDELRATGDTAAELRSNVIGELGAAAVPHGSDILLAVRAAAAGARWFVTEDVAFRRACTGTLKTVADIEVVSVSEMILAADQAVRGELYGGRYLQGTDIEVREVNPGEIDGLAPIFVNQRDGEKLRMWRAHLHSLVTSVAETRLYVFCDEQGPLALAALTTSEVLEVPICRVRRGPAEPTLARQLLGWLREHCASLGACAVQITDDRPGRWLQSGYRAEGFLIDQRPIAVPLKGVASIQRIAAVLMRDPLAQRLGSQHAETLMKLPPAPEAAHSVEATFHPVIVSGCGLRTIRIPIKAAFAADLFDSSLSEGQLWSRERPLALRREHVYFRTPSASAMFSAPARIVWQVTGPARAGGGTIRGWSLLDDVVVGSVDQLINRFSHLGVLDETAIRGMAKAATVMALRFSHTTVFNRPVSLADYRRVMHELRPGVGLTHAGPQPVDEQVFVQLATLGS